MDKEEIISRIQGHNLEEYGNTFLLKVLEQLDEEQRLL